MQRVLVILVVVVLVTASLGGGALAANWPFWRRAWAWHVADGGMPAIDWGPRVAVRGGNVAALQFAAADEDLARFVAGAPSTTALLRVRNGRYDAWVATPDATQSMLDGRGLTAMVLAPLFAQLARQHAGLLDQPAGAWLEQLRLDARGAVPIRTLLARLEGGLPRAPTATPLNPFRASARLASGPDFHTAAVALFEAQAQLGVAEQQAVAAQMLASIAAAMEQRPFADVLARHLWSARAQADASLLLDRPRGEAGAHCCMRALAADWLRVGLWLGAEPAAVGNQNTLREFHTPGRSVVTRAGAALLWVGEGARPAGLDGLLADHAESPLGW